MTAIEACSIGKRYRRNDRMGRRAEKRWALRDVTFDIARGETVGLIGRNGSGKSSLLRIAAGITRPTVGTIQTSGRLAGVLSLGEGFHPLLSGRENAMTALLLSGRTRREARRRVDAIRAFTELEQAFDEPIRTYSSGMFVRLAFGVAFNVDADILIIDEALAVGDLSFSSKCLDHIEVLQRLGATIMLASHDLGQIERLCNRVIWLVDGTIAGLGSPEVVNASYQREAHEETLRRSSDQATPHRLGSHEVRIDRIELVQTGADSGGPLHSGGPLAVGLAWSADEEVREALFGVSIHHESGTLVLDLSSAAAVVGSGRRSGCVTLKLDRLDLGPGRYHLDVGVYPADWSYAFDYQWQARWFDVVGSQPGSGYRPPHRWRMS